MTENRYNYLGEFEGCDACDEELDAILAYGIAKGDLEHARSLFGSKWYDYRFMHPGASLFYFIHQYIAHLAKWRARFGVPLKVKFKFQGHPVYRMVTEASKGRRIEVPKVTRTSLFRGMCYADEFGIPYDKYMSGIFQYAFENKWQKLPHPTQLYNTPALSYLLDVWAEDQKNIITIPKDPRYQVPNEGHRFQIEYQDYLLNLISKRSIPHLALAHYLEKNPLVSLERAQDTLPPETIAKALELLATR